MFRFNVAITRAKALLIVVGNPFLLCMDLCWKNMIHFAKENGKLQTTSKNFPAKIEPSFKATIKGFDVSVLARLAMSLRKSSIEFPPLSYHYLSLLSTTLVGFSPLLQIFLKLFRHQNQQFGQFSNSRANSNADMAE